MSKYNSLFSQLLGFFPRHEFHRMVKEHNAGRKFKFKAKLYSIDATVNLFWTALNAILSLSIYYLA
jgi:hypothetical protein